MRTLLLADDSVTTQRVVALTFADEAFRVVTVSDGQQALDAMASMRPDIVLAGTTLPRTNGYELSAKMRDTTALRDVPVLLLSGAFESVDAARLTASGARGVIEKPLEPTAVISRVRELLGLKDAKPAAPVGRLVTSGSPAADRKAPPRPPAAVPARAPQVSSWDELRKETLEPEARSVEGGTPGSSREDYLDTLDAAFDSLDQHLAGRQEPATAHRNPSGPLGQSAGAADPRSPGRRPSMTSEQPAPNAVFEVDHDWFSPDTTAADQAAGRDMISDAHEAMPARPEAAPGNAVFEVDDEWFAADEEARAARLAQQRDLAAEMGIHDVELPPAEPAPNAAAPAADLDFDFGLNDLMAVAPAAAPVADTPVVAPLVTVAPIAPPVVTVTPAAVAPPPVAVAPPPPVVVAQVVPPAPVAVSGEPSPPASVADDFAALLAFETGDGPALTHPAPVPVVVPAPEITDAMLDQIAERVVARLNAATFGAELRGAMTAAVRDTVRSVVTETSERLVRDEIARIKARAERDTQ
jgi:CheY-like chemotaxis protein